MRFVPAESTERIGAHHESADAVEFSWNRSMWPSLLQVDDDHSLGRISGICSDTDANHRVILHQPVAMVFFGQPRTLHGADQRSTSRTLR